MPGTEDPLLDHSLGRFWQCQQPEQVRYLCAIFPDGLGDLLLRQLEIIDELAITARLFDSVEIRPLQVLDESEHEHSLIVEVTDDGGNLAPADVGSRAQPALAGDEFVRIPATPNGDRLQQPACRERSLELAELGRVEHSARLKWVGSNSRDRYSLKIALWQTGGSRGPGNQRFETPPKPPGLLGAHFDLRSNSLATFI